MPSPVSYKVIEGTKSRTCVYQNYPGCFLCSAPLISPPTTWGASLFSSHLRKRGPWEVRRPAHGHMLNAPHLGFAPCLSDSKAHVLSIRKVAPNKEVNTGKCESNFWKCPGSSWKARPPALALLRNLDACQPLVSVNHCHCGPVPRALWRFHVEVFWEIYERISTSLVILEMQSKPHPVCISYPLDWQKN